LQFSILFPGGPIAKKDRLGCHTQRSHDIPDRASQLRSGAGCAGQLGNHYSPPTGAFGPRGSLGDDVGELSVIFS
jgi:hypothetical protein